MMLLSITNTPSIPWMWIDCKRKGQILIKKNEEPWVGAGWKKGIRKKAENWKKSLTNSLKYAILFELAFL